MRKMNKKAQTLGLAVIIAITIFIVGMLSVNFLTPEITRARNSANLDCSQTLGNISDGVKLTCLTIDLVVPYFIVLIFSVAGGIIVSRFMG